MNDTFRRETILIACFPILAFLFLVTGAATRAYHAKQAGLAREWYGKGRAALARGEVGEAIQDLHAAFVYSHGDAVYELDLAKALISAHRTEEARTYLMALRDRDPENGPVNLELARLAAERGDAGEAVRYFHSAIYGLWPERPEEQRRAAWLELYHFLMSRGQRSEALAELTALAVELPPDPALQTQVGDLFLEAKDYERALHQYEGALRLEPNHEPALRGAGEAAFNLGDYRQAERYLRRALRLDRHDSEAAQRLELAQAVLDVDPFDPLLPPAERRQRVVRAFDQSLARLVKCAHDHRQSLQPGPGSLASLYAEAETMRAEVRRPQLERRPDRLSAVMNLVFQMETATTEACGPPSGLDEAITLAASKHLAP
jgi:tetratricopeptide (TPR) repeat protein